MIITYTSIPLDARYVEVRTILKKSLRDPGAPRQSAQAKILGDVLVSSMMEALIHQLVESVEMKPLTKKIMKQLGAVVEKTSTVLVEKVIAKLKNEELLPILEYMTELEVEHEGVLYLCCPLDEARAGRLIGALDEIDAGNGDAARVAFLEELLYVEDVALLEFYKRPLDLVKLGMIARKIVDVGYVTLGKASHSAVKKMVSKMDQHELESLGDYARMLLMQEETQEEVLCVAAEAG